MSDRGGEEAQTLQGLSVWGKAGSSFAGTQRVRMVEGDRWRNLCSISAIGRKGSAMAITLKWGHKYLGGVCCKFN